MWYGDADFFYGYSDIEGTKLKISFSADTSTKFDMELDWDTKTFLNGLMMICLEDMV